MRLGLVGAGSVAAVHVQAAEDLADVEVVAVCDVRREAARALSARAHARVYADHREMFDAGGLDGVIITAPHSLHTPIAADAARAGLHILMEKPMATTLADCRRMIQDCERHGVRLAVGNVQRYQPDVREAVRVLRSGVLGVPLFITMRRTVSYDRGSRPQWFFDPVLAGGGVMMNIGGHCIDKAQVLAGSLAVSVHAQVFRRPGIEVETETLGLLKMAGGVQVGYSITSSGLPPQDETEVICQNGALRLSEAHGLWMYRSDTATQLHAPSAADFVTALRDQLADFARLRQPTVDGAYGRSVVAAVLAAYESAERGEPVLVRTLLEEAVA